jgi:sec-independent protein translocase protein TatA
MEGLSATHLILVLVVVMIVFGTGKLPEVGSALGKGIRDFKKALNEPEEPERLDIQGSGQAKEEAHAGSFEEKPSEKQSEG